MELKSALAIGNRIVTQLELYCGIINIAGSCRRGKPEVKDIEIVALPKMIAAQDLFGNSGDLVRVPAWKETVYGLGIIEKGSTDGKYMQIHLKESINLDLFMPDDFDYHRQFAIRTGSADWVAKYIAGGWKYIGWCGSDAGLRMQSQCEGVKGSDNKMKWKCVVPGHQQILPPHWKSEDDFFEWLQLKWIEPRLREIK